MYVMYVILSLSRRATEERITLSPGCLRHNDMKLEVELKQNMVVFHHIHEY